MTPIWLSAECRNKNVRGFLVICSNYKRAEHESLTWNFTKANFANSNLNSNKNTFSEKKLLSTLDSSGWIRVILKHRISLGQQGF